MVRNWFKSLSLLPLNILTVLNFATLQAQAQSNQLYVTSLGSDQVLKYDAATGDFLGTFISSSGELNAPDGFTFGPDGNVYVSGYYSDNIVEYDGRTGKELSTFAAGINGPAELVFDQDGNLLVNRFGGEQTPCSATDSCSVLKYDGKTGGFLRVFASGGGLNAPDGLSFGPDGNLYVGSFSSNQVLEYDGKTGNFLGVFASGGGLSSPSGIVFGPDDNLYVTSSGTEQILKYDGKTGNFLGDFASGGGLNFPTRLAFGPDSNLYVSGLYSNNVLKYDGKTGTFLGTFISGVSLPTDLDFVTVTVPESSSMLGILAFGVLTIVTFRQRKQRKKNLG